MVLSQSFAWASVIVPAPDELLDRRKGLFAGIFDGEIHVNDSSKERCSSPPADHRRITSERGALKER